MNTLHLKKQGNYFKLPIKPCSLDVCTEEYTSQTCGRCGERQKMGGKDIYKCNHCGLVIDKDVNGTRNIAIKRKNEILLKLFNELKSIYSFIIVL